MEASRTLARVDSSGLTEAEAAARLAERGSSARPATSRSYSSIVRANTLTVFNAILAFFGTLTLVFGDWRDALFLGILAANTAIGIGQEVRAKRALDRLAALVAPTGKVVRDGLVHPVPVDQVGRRRSGPAGSRRPGDRGRYAGVRRRRGTRRVQSHRRVDTVERATGERVYSGSFVAEGSGEFVVEAGGPESRAARLATVARALRHERSPLVRAMDRLLLGLAAVSVPLGLALVVAGAPPPDRRSRRANRDGIVSQPGPGGVNPVGKPYRGGVGREDGAARGARPAAQRDRVAGLGRPAVHRQDRHSHRGAAARRRPGASGWRHGDAAASRAEPLCRQLAVTQPDVAGHRRRAPE